MSESLGWGITGIGWHVEGRMAPAFHQATDTKLIAVHSRSMERGRLFATKHGVEHVYDSFEEMLQNPELDVLYIATPNNLHMEQTIQAAQAGKHILCEKPMALTESDCERMIEVCKKNNVKLGIVFQNRHHPAHVEAHRLIQTGKIGEIPVVTAQYGNSFLKSVLRRDWRGDPNMAGGGALMATALHPVDLLRFLLDSEVAEVSALCEPQPPLIDEVVYVILNFVNGTRGIVISGVVPRGDNDVTLYGTKAKITGKGTVGMPLRGELLVEGDSINMKMAFPTNTPESDNYLRLVETFNRCIRENTEPDISGHEGLQMCRIANAILESSRQGKTIKI